MLPTEQTDVNTSQEGERKDLQVQRNTSNSPVK